MFCFLAEGDGSDQRMVQVTLGSPTGDTVKATKLVSRGWDIRPTALTLAPHTSREQPGNVKQKGVKVKCEDRGRESR